MKLDYARPGTVRRKRNWRPWVAATLWLLPLSAGVVSLVRPGFIEHMPPLVVIAVLVVALPALLISLVAGWFVFPKSLRDSAAAILLIVLAILLPVMMWLRAGV